MVWVIAIGIIIIYIVFKSRSEYNSDIDKHITRYGGMRKKFHILVDYFEESGYRQVQETAGSLLFRKGSSQFRLDVIMPNLEIRHETPLKHLNCTWKFRLETSQISMLQKMDADIEAWMQTLEQ